LGFAPEQLDAKFQTLSGGWRSRCALASALLQKPDLVSSLHVAVYNVKFIYIKSWDQLQLILDEPTNYLDIPSVLYLQKYLQELTETTILIVAHDREFLDAVTQETIILRGQSLAYHEGSITVYERAALQKRKSKIRQQNALDKKRELVEKSITEGARAAKKSGDENKARMVKSRQKKLDERWGMEKNEKGHRRVLPLTIRIR
jgi:ATP-binding cassette subfamily F protein 3